MMAPLLPSRRPSQSKAAKCLFLAAACVLAIVVFTRTTSSSNLQHAPLAGVRAPAAQMRMSRSINLRTNARKNDKWMQNLGEGVAALGLVGSMAMGTPALASEFDVLDAPKPTNGYIMDDTPCLQKGSEKKINEELSFLEVGKGYKLNVITTRKLEDSPDADTLGQRMLDKWSSSDKANSGVLVLVGKNSEVALVGGDKFLAALGEDTAGSIAQETVGYFASEGRPNQGVSEGVNRIRAVLSGEADPGPPVIKAQTRERTYKTKDEVEASKGASIQVVGALLLIAFVVPMLQYAGYVQKD